MDIFDSLESPLICKPLQSLKFKTMKEAQNIIYIISWKTTVTCKAWRMKEQKKAQVWSHLMKGSFNHWKTSVTCFQVCFANNPISGLLIVVGLFMASPAVTFISSFTATNTRIVISFVVFTLFLGWESLFDLLLLLVCACQVLRHGGRTSSGDLTRWSLGKTSNNSFFAEHFVRKGGGGGYPQLRNPF